jgi:AcrR family transcriptional regulator
MTPTASVETPLRSRILEAAFSTFVEHGYAQASTLEIASRARVSKRELYAIVGNKQQMLVACITERASRIQLPPDVPALRDRAQLAEVLAAFGARVLREVSAPTVVAVFRLAIAEAERAPEIAVALDSIGRAAARAALASILAQAGSAGLLSGDPAEVAARFTALLWGDLMLNLLLRVTDPHPRDLEQRAHDAADAVLQLYPAPEARAAPKRAARRRS